MLPLPEPLAPIAPSFHRTFSPRHDLTWAVAHAAKTRKELVNGGAQEVKMEPNTPQQETTTVGRVQVPEIVLSHPHHGSVLAGTLSGCHITSANSARRRLYGPTLLGSPARRGHSPRMADIFGDAKNNLASKSVPAMKAASPQSMLRQLPFRPRPVSAINSCDVQMNTVLLPELAEGVPLYPKLPFDQDSVVSKPGSSPEAPGIENGNYGMQSSRVYPRLSPAPLSRQDSYFSRPPQISHAQIVPMSSIHTPTNEVDDELSSSSSASWTGDSQFFMPRQRRVLPLAQMQEQERKSSVPDWLECLPAEPEEFEKAEDADDEREEEVVPLSPAVEIERGSMRRKMRGSAERKRRRSCSDEDEGVSFVRSTDE